MRTVWIPEAPNHPGLYANESDMTGGSQPSTMNPHKAKHFPTRDACERWCDTNPVPAFRPTEHGFED